MIDFKRTITNDGIAIVRVEGWLEEFACPYFVGCMEDLIKDGHREIVIDCTNLGLLSSACLSSLIKARRRAVKSGGRIILANPNSSILEVIGFLGLKSLFGIYPTCDQALIKIRRRLRKQRRKNVDQDSVLVGT